MSGQDVVVTGMALVAPMAMDAESLFARLADGQSSLRRHPRFEQLGFANPAAGYLDDGQWQRIDAAVPAARHLPAQSRLVEYLADQVLEDAGLTRQAFARTASGLFLGCNKFCASGSELQALSRCMDEQACVDLDALLDDADAHEPAFARRVDQQTAHLAALLQVRERVATLADACAAGTTAIGSAYRAIARGEIDLALCGASELMATQISCYSFNGLGALCPRGDWPAATQSRPFMTDRCGFVMSEGAALLVLESADHARRRQAWVRGRVLGYANACEAQKITSSSRDGSRYAQCMQAAIDDAGVPLASIGHVNVHGTSTPSNDSCEALALERVFGAALGQVSITASKSALGHSLAASGALEAVLTLMSMERGIVLPTLNYQAEGSEFPHLDVVTHARHQAIDHALSTSFGFGGINSSLVLGRA